MILYAKWYLAERIEDIIRIKKLNLDSIRKREQQSVTLQSKIKKLNIQMPEKSIFIAISKFYPHRLVATFIFKKKPFEQFELDKLKNVTKKAWI